MAEKKPLRIGLVGYGFMGRTHSNAFRKVSNFFDLKYEPQLAAVCARNKDRVEAFAEQWGYESVETDWKKLIARDDIDVIELNEAFAAQGLAVLRELGIADDDTRVNPNGGAIALGHPLGMSGARLLMTAAHQLQRTGGRYALCTMCVGVGQGIATLIERV